jgi:hypothetical protein
MARVAAGGSQQIFRMAIDYQGIVAHGLAIQIATRIRAAILEGRLRVAEQHQRLYQALADRDADGACRALKAYMRDLRRQYDRAQLARTGSGKTTGVRRRA